MILVENELKNFYIRPPIDWDNLGEKDLITRDGKISAQKMASDLSTVGYIPRYGSNANAQVQSQRLYCTTTNCRYINMATYDIDGNVIRTYNAPDADCPVTSSSLGDSGYGLYSGSANWFELGYFYIDGSKPQCHKWNPGTADVAAGVQGLGVSSDAKYIYVLSWERGSGGNLTCGTTKISRFDTSNHTFSTIVACEGCLMNIGDTRRIIEVGDVTRVYIRASAGFNSYNQTVYRHFYLEVDKVTGTGSYVGIEESDFYNIFNNYPDGEFDNFTDMNLQINHSNTSTGDAYFGGMVVGKGYFRRGWDNVAKEYLYKPVFN